MAIAAGALNRRVQFSRRAAAPTSPGSLREGFFALGDPTWAAFKDGRPRERDVAGFTLVVKTGTLTLRDDSFARSITARDRVTVAGDEYEVLGDVAPDRPDGSIRLELLGAPNRESYAREFDQRGEVVTLKRGPYSAPTAQAAVRAIVTGYAGAEITGGLQQGERKLLISAADVEVSGFGPPQPRESIDARGVKLTINDVDGNTHRVAGVLNAYLVTAEGTS